jgi:NAD(P)-dependent dehydrogenase (short-subunit alcohol dehydrogenase family)
MHVVITGANRGIGLEFVRRYLQRGDRVDAGVRHPESAHELKALEAASGKRLRVFACDVANESSVRAFAEAIGNDTSVDLLVNNAGIFGSRQSLAEMDFADLARTFDTNALGTLRVTLALLSHLRRGSVRKIVNISSKVGSIADNTTSGYYGYRMSKAALNIATKNLAIDLREEKFTVLAVHPGWVQTAMGGPNAPTTIEESVQGLMREIDRRGLEDSGAFFDFTGNALPW